MWPRALLALLAIAVLTPAMLLGAREGWTPSTIALVVGPSALLAILYARYERTSPRPAGQEPPRWWRVGASPKYALWMGGGWLLLAAVHGIGAFVEDGSPWWAVPWAALGVGSLVAGRKHRQALRDGARG